MTFAEPGPGGHSKALACARLDADGLRQVATVFAQKPQAESSPPGQAPPAIQPAAG